MARVSKYKLIERKQREHVEKYDKSVKEYALQKKVTKASYAELIEMIFKREITSVSYFLQSNNPNYWQALITKIRQSENTPNYNDNLKKILLHIASVSETFFIEIDSLNIIFTVTQLEPYFVRKIETWSPKSRNRFKQNYELLRHLFAKYEVPEFLDKGFIKGELESIELFNIIGLGKSFKDFELAPKIVLNKKTYHHILTTPVEFTFFEAFRRAQVLSLGGNEKLVNCLLGSKLRDIESRQQNHEEFWVTVIQFFINQPMFDYDHVSQIIDYIYNKKYQTRYDNGRVLPPEQADFSIKGRTIQALLRQTEDWHNQLARVDVKRRVNIKSWKPFEIDHFETLLTNGCRYQIIQYTTAQELVQEGAEMRHCVGSYSHSCATGSTSIWSLRQVTNKGFDFKKMVTIELNNRNKTIQQIRGKNNRKSDSFETSIINLWANKEGLSYSRYA